MPYPYDNSYHPYNNSPHSSYPPQTSSTSQPQENNPPGSSQMQRAPARAISSPRAGSHFILEIPPSLIVKNAAIKNFLIAQARKEGITVQELCDGDALFNTQTAQHTSLCNPDFIVHRLALERKETLFVRYENNQLKEISDAGHLDVNLPPFAKGLDLILPNFPTLFADCKHVQRDGCDIRVENGEGLSNILGHHTWDPENYTIRVNAAPINRLPISDIQKVLFLITTLAHEIGHAKSHTPVRPRDYPDADSYVNAREYEEGHGMLGEMELFRQVPQNLRNDLLAIQNYHAFPRQRMEIYSNLRKSIESGSDKEAAEDLARQELGKLYSSQYRDPTNRPNVTQRQIWHEEWHEYNRQRYGAP